MAYQSSYSSWERILWLRQCIGLLCALVPLYKKGDPSVCANYRTISLIHVSHASKILLKVILGRITPKTELEVAEEQAGFRSQRGKTGEEQKRLPVLSSWSRLRSYIGHGKLRMMFSFSVQLGKNFDLQKRSHILYGPTSFSLTPRFCWVDDVTSKNQRLRLKYEIKYDLYAYHILHNK